MIESVIRLLLVLTAAVTAFQVNARDPRSHAAKAEFQRQQPCPATGRTKGKCPGYVIDHLNPLACGGAGAPENMQWQTIADAKAKDKWERKACQK